MPTNPSECWQDRFSHIRRNKTIFRTIYSMCNLSVKCPVSPFVYISFVNRFNLKDFNMTGIKINNKGHLLTWKSFVLICLTVECIQLCLFCCLSRFLCYYRTTEQEPCQCVIYYISPMLLMLTESEKSVPWKEVTHI